jgi:hypothetical protein
MTSDHYAIVNDDALACEERVERIFSLPDGILGKPTLKISTYGAVA